MGSVISKAANAIGAAIGTTFIAPIKTIFNASCEGVCSGTWDIACFIVHLCITSLVKLFMILCLIYIILLFIYLLFKVGIIQCIGRSLCKMTWAALREYWIGLNYIICFLWYKLKNTKRVYRGRFRDLEAGYIISSEDENYCSSRRVMSMGRIRKSVRERRKDRMRWSLNQVRSGHKGSCRSHSHHHVRLKTREVSVRLRDSSVGRRRRRTIYKRTTR